MITGTRLRPSRTHRLCFTRNMYGSLLRSMVTTADALHTITTLVQTRSSVAMKSTLSDLSFRAILRDPKRLKVPGTSAETHCDVLDRGPQTPVLRRRCRPESLDPGRRRPCRPAATRERSAVISR